MRGDNPANSPSPRTRDFQTTAHLALTLLLTGLTLATTATTATGSTTTPPTAQADTLTAKATQFRCQLALQHPLALIKLWLATSAQGQPPACQLTTPTYQPSDPPFRPITVALIEPLKTTPNHGHQLYRIHLENQTKMGTYIIDLKSHPNHRWLIDLWTQT
jgi:hypothetical protein